MLQSLRPAETLVAEHAHICTHICTHKENKTPPEASDLCTHLNMTFCLYTVMLSVIKWLDREIQLQDVIFALAGHRRVQD